MANVVRGMDGAMKSMDLEKVCGQFAFGDEVYAVREKKRSYNTILLP